MKELPREVLEEPQNPEVPTAGAASTSGAVAVFHEEPAEGEGPEAPTAEGENLELPEPPQPAQPPEPLSGRVGADASPHPKAPEADNPLFASLPEAPATVTHVEAVRVVPLVNEEPFWIDSHLVRNKKRVQTVSTGDQRRLLQL